MDSDLLCTTEAGYFSLTQAVVISDVTRIFQAKKNCAIHARLHEYIVCIFKFKLLTLHELVSHCIGASSLS